MAHTARHQTLDVGDWAHVMQLPATVYEGSQPARIQRGLGVVAAVGTNPGVLQAGRRSGPFARVLLKHGGYEVPCGLADSAEVLVREAEVQLANVHTGLLQALVKERGDSAQHDVSQHANAPHGGGQRHWCSLDQLRSRELWVAKE